MEGGTKRHKKSHTSSSSSVSAGKRAKLYKARMKTKLHNVNAFGVAVKANRILQPTSSATDTRKTIDYPIAAVGSKDVIPTTTATFDLLNGLKQGNGFWERIGGRIRMKSIQIRASMYPSLSANAGDETFTILLVYDRNPNKAAPSIGDILQDVDWGGATHSHPLSGLNMSNANRFVVLRREWFTVPGSTTAVTQSGASWGVLPNCIDWYVKLGGLETDYAASTGLIGDITSGALWLVSYGDLSTGSAHFEFKSRIRYDD